MSSTIKQVRKAGKRDNEIIQGWDSYHSIACKLGFKWLRYYFPTREDLIQAAALAATVAQVALGEETRLGDLTPVLRRILKQQATAYGMRQRQVHRADGSLTMQTIRREIPFAGLQDDLEQAESVEAESWYETRMMLVGVGEWTRRQASILYDLGR